MSLGFGTAPAPVLPLWVDLSAKGLTVYAEDVPLRSVLDEIARMTGIRVRLDDGDRNTLTIAFEDVPVEEGLRRVLRGRNFFMVAVPQGSIERAHVYRKPGGSPSRSPSESIVASGLATNDRDRQDDGRIAEVRSEALANPNARTRLRALERLAASADTSAANAAVIEVLQRESNPALLERALDIVGQDPSTPLDVVMRLAQSNADPQVRIKALTHLSQRGAPDARVRHTFEVLAADDPVPEVRRAAKRVLQALKLAP